MGAATLLLGLSSVERVILSLLNMFTRACLRLFCVLLWFTWETWMATAASALVVQGECYLFPLGTLSHGQYLSLSCKYIPRIVLFQGYQLYRKYSFDKHSLSPWPWTRQINNSIIKLSLGAKDQRLWRHSRWCTTMQSSVTKGSAVQKIETDFWLYMTVTLKIAIPYSRMTLWHMVMYRHDELTKSLVVEKILSAHFLWP